MTTHDFIGHQAPSLSPLPSLRIGYQKSASLFVLQKAQGTLEKKLAPLVVSQP